MSEIAAPAPAAPGTTPVDPNKKKTTGPIHNPRYKSILCDHWERNNGVCPYAEKCQFAHGQAELLKWQAHRQRVQANQVVGGRMPSPSQIPQIPQQQIPSANWGIAPSPNSLSPPKQQQQQPPSISLMQPFTLSPVKGYDQYQYQNRAYPTTPPMMYHQQVPTGAYQSQNMFQNQQLPMSVTTPQQQQYFSNTRPTQLQTIIPQQPEIPRPSSVPTTPTLPPNPSPIPSHINVPHIPLYGKRPVSPDDDLSVGQRSMAEQSNRASDPRRTASLPQLFSRDFLSSSIASPNNDESNNWSSGPSSRLNVELPPPPTIHYSGSRRGSAPPVVLSVATNSLVDLDSLADELVSEPATSTSQLFSMPTVFPGSINEYL